MAIHMLMHPLNRADGSAIYTSPNGYSVVAAVNGPVEVQRREELPEEAHIEVNVRPHEGVGQVKERHLEAVIANTLRDVIFTEMFPRQMVQLTLQITKVPVDDHTLGRMNPQVESYLPVLPWLLNAACLALLDAAIPMRCTFTSTIIAVMSKTIMQDHPNVKEVTAAISLHVLTFSSKEELLLTESEGRFSTDDWDIIQRKAKIICLGDDDAMGEGSLQGGLRSIVAEKVRWHERWKME